MTKLKNTILTSLTDDGKGNIWIGTENEGITIYDGKGEVKSILKGSHVNTLYLDTQNTMWPNRKARCHLAGTVRAVICQYQF